MASNVKAGARRPGQGSGGPLSLRRPRTLLLAGLVCSNVLLFALSAHSLQQSRRQYELRAEVQTQNIAGALDQNLAHNIDKIDLALDALTDELERQLAGKGLDEAAMNAFISRLEQRLPAVEAFRVARADGRVILGKGVKKAEAERASWADRDYFLYHRDHADSSLQIAKPRIGRVSRQYIVNFSQRYNHPDGRFAGVVSAPIAVDHFNRLLARYDLGPNGIAVIRDADLGLVARMPALPGRPAGEVGNNAVSAELRGFAEAGVAAATFYTDAGADGVRRTVSFRRLEKAPLLVIAGAARDDYLAGWSNEVYKTLAMASGFMALSLLLGGFLLRLLAQAEKREQALAESETRLRTLIEAVPDAIQFKDGDGRWLIANDVCLRLFGLDGGLAGQAWQGLTDAEIGALQPPLSAALAAGKASDDAAWAARQTCRSEETLADGDGRSVCLDVIKVPLFDGERRRAIVVVGRDITGRKASEAELAQYRHQLEALVEQRTDALLETEARASHILRSSADGLYGVDRNGIVTFINPAGCAILGYRVEDVVGRSAHALFHHSRADGSAYPASDCPSHNALRCGEDVRVDNEVYWHADGHAVPVMYAMHPIVQDGEVSGGVTSFVDMSVQRAAAEAREEALVAAENLARVRREFLANMSHEIRTPLNGVLGFAEIGYRNSRPDEKAHDTFAKIIVSGKRLLGVINDVLDFSKIEAGKLRIEQTEVRLADIVAQAVELVRDRAEAKRLALRVELAPDLPPVVLGDPLRIGQILLNLLSNAVKFTDSGSVALSLGRQGDRLRCAVADTGIGMNEAQLAQLFSPFQQADASASRRFGGTGLGLAITKRLLELMGGDIAVDSRPGAGCSVVFRLPYLAPAAPPSEVAAAAAPAASRPLAGISILVAEDDAINQMVLAENLAEEGARVVMVGNGREAVERVLADGRAAYDIVLMDLQMPELDGYQAARRLAALMPGLPIVAQSAHAFADEKAKCLAVGMVAHVAKPIDPAELVRTVLQHVPARRPAAKGPPV